MDFWESKTSRIIWEQTPRPPSRIILGAAPDWAADGGRRAASHTALPTYISKDQNLSSPAARHSNYTPKFFFACGAPFDLHPQIFLRLRRAILLIQKLGGLTEHNLGGWVEFALFLSTQ